MSINNKMTTIADKIRGLIGSSEKMGLDAMATNLDIEKNHIDAALNAVANRGVVIPNGSNSGNLSGLINSIGSASVIKKEGTFKCQYGETQYVPYPLEELKDYHIDVNIGFKPDLLIIHSHLNRDPNVYDFMFGFIDMTAWFTPNYIDNPLAWWICETYDDREDEYINCIVKPNDNGFTVFSLFHWYSDSEQSYWYRPEDEFAYTAIKFT